MIDKHNTNLTFTVNTPKHEWQSYMVYHSSSSSILNKALFSMFCHLSSTTHERLCSVIYTKKKNMCASCFPIFTPALTFFTDETKQKHVSPTWFYNHINMFVMLVISTNDSSFINFFPFEKKNNIISNSSQ